MCLNHFFCHSLKHACALNLMHGGDEVAKNIYSALETHISEQSARIQSF